jgi:ribosomal protein S18 acetylase RimI-like enzyme
VANESHALTVTAAPHDVLASVDRYFDAAPRSDATAEAVGPFTLFRSGSVWSYHARPRRGLDTPVTVEDVTRLAARCDELGLELSIEWIGELTPSLERVVAAGGLEVERHALLVLRAGELRPVAPPADVAVELLGADDPRLVAARGIAEVSFGAGGTGVGADGPAARDERAARIGEDMRAHLRRRGAAELTLTAAATDPADGVVAAGSLQPAGPAAEIVAVATLPSHRRRGLAAAVTTALVHEARRRGIPMTLLSAQDDAVARVYERVGFRRVGTHLAAARGRA